MSAKGLPRVLIVEDEPLVRYIASDEFAEAGYEVIAVPDGHAAIEALDAGTSFDLLFTDIRMPGTIDGWSVAAAARSRLPNLPVIYATGFSEEQHRMVQHAVFFKKPYRMTAILQAARQLGLSPGATSDHSG